MRVEILDQTYHIQGEVDEAYMTDLAAYVDEKLRVIAKGARSMDTQRVAVLAALNIADELFTARRDAASTGSQLRQRASRALASVELALKESASEQAQVLTRRPHPA